MELTVSHHPRHHRGRRVPPTGKLFMNIPLTTIHSSTVAQHPGPGRSLRSLARDLRRYCEEVCGFPTNPDPQLRDSRSAP